MPRRAVARLVLCLVLGVSWTGCRNPHPAGDSSLELFAQGRFLASGEWIDFRQRHAETIAHQALLPATHLATVEGEWGGDESWGGWGVGDVTRLNFFLRWPKTYQLYLRCRAAEHPEDKPQTLEVRINDRELARLEIGSTWQVERVDIPEGLLKRGNNRVELIYGWHLEGDPAVDPRRLALAFEAVGLLEPGRQPRDAHSASDADGAIELDREADVLKLTRTGTFLVPWSVPENARGVELSIRTKGHHARLRAGVMTIDGLEQSAFEATEGRHRIDLTSYRGRDLFLVFDADLPRGGRVDLRFPRRLAAEPSPATTASSTAAASRPNVVIVVLDAARADRFGVYGYERDTTPHIDQLATEGLVFESALAECPYTTCSMPNLLAGLSFRQHGVVSRGQKLAEEARTLAEELSGLGYQTLGFTGNPNSSRATGAAQGFDEFHEVWRLAEGRDRTHPGFLTDRVIERLGEPDERPLFLLVHYVPPHEPYDPDPAFDVFTDPDYAGPVTGEQRFIQSVFAREIELDAADLAELSALYDGNLKMADHAVFSLTEALRRTGRWDDTLFVLTSDHGEAFDEHGYLGHNETLYEEMLRVPLILRLPGGIQPASASTSRLASLGDVMPTVLGYLGHPSPTEILGEDLLHPATPATRDRLLWLRSSHEAGTIFGVRTPRFKLMARASASWAAGWFRLFDLAEDPSESSDRASEKRLLQAALTLRLERALQSRGGQLSAEELAIPEEDREMLRSLGYL